MKYTENQVNEASIKKAAKRSEGGIYLAAGLLFLIWSSMAPTLSPEGLWIILLPSFGFSLLGLFLARGITKRILAIILTGVSGGLCLSCYLSWIKL